MQPELQQVRQACADTIALRKRVTLAIRCSLLCVAGGEVARSAPSISQEALTRIRNHEDPAKRNSNDSRRQKINAPGAAVLHQSPLSQHLSTEYIRTAQPIKMAKVLKEASAAGGVPNLSGTHGSRAALHTLRAADEGHSAEGSCKESQGKSAGHGELSFDRLRQSLT